MKTPEDLSNDIHALPHHVLAKLVHKAVAVVAPIIMICSMANQSAKNVHTIEGDMQKIVNDIGKGLGKVRQRESDQQEKTSAIHLGAQRIHKDQRSL